MARLRHPNGAVVVVPDEKVEHLVRNGFTAEPEQQTTKKAPAKKAASSKTSSK